MYNFVRQNIFLQRFNQEHCCKKSVDGVEYIVTLIIICLQKDVNDKNRKNLKLMPQCPLEDEKIDRYLKKIFIFFFLHHIFKSFVVVLRHYILHYFSTV